jgi:hypothetical protein
MMRKPLRLSAIPFCGKRTIDHSFASSLALAALLRMRHDCGNSIAATAMPRANQEPAKSNNQAAIRARRDKGDRFP